MVSKIRQPLNSLDGLQRKFAGAPMSAKLVISLASYSRKLRAINGSYINLNSIDVFQEIHDSNKELKNDELNQIYKAIVDLVNDYIQTAEAKENLIYKPPKERGYFKNLLGL